MSALETVSPALEEGGDPIGERLVVPPRPATLVSRARLLRGLDRATRRPVTVVTGPPGAGKTVLLADWAAHSPRRVIWLSLDPMERHPLRFWALVATTLRRAAPVGEGENPVPLRERRASPTELISTLIEDLWRLGPAVIVIDDFDRLEGPVEASVPELIANLPPGISLVLSCRETPSLPLHRLRLAGELAEVKEADLRFDLAEATELLEGVAERRLDPLAVSALVLRTEGWAAGLQLAGLSLRVEHDTTDFVRHFTGNARLVSEYLIEEVLAHESEETVRFLLETSVLDELTPAVCAGVTGRSDAGAVLAELARRNLFVVNLDDEAERYRYHQLFADLLWRLLRNESPERARRIHLRAGESLARLGDAARAVPHFAAAGADDRVFELAVAATVRQYERGIDLDGELPLGLEAPEEWLSSDPLRIYLWIALLQSGLRTSEADHWLGVLSEHAVVEAGDAWLSARLYMVSVVQAALLRDDTAVQDLATQLGGLLGGDGMPPCVPASGAAPRTASWLSQLDGTLAGLVADLVARSAPGTFTGRPGGAVPVMLTRPIHSDRSVVHLEASASAALGAGRLRDAFTDARLVLEETERRKVGRPAVAIGARLVLSAVYRERDETDSAEQQLGLARSLAEQAGNPAWSAEVELEAARLFLAQGRDREALDGFGRLRWMDAWDRLPSRTRTELAVLEARHALDRGELDAAVALAEALADRCPAGLRARIELGAARPDRARDHLGAAKYPSTPRGQLERLMLLARTELQFGKVRAARSAVARAVEVARSEWYVRSFLDEGAAFMELVADEEAGSSDPYRSMLAERAPSDRPHPDVLPEMNVEPLTSKEREVLLELTSHLSLQEIATELYISLNTVKTHVRGIYRKLGVGTRSEAVATARGHGLL